MQPKQFVFENTNTTEARLKIVVEAFTAEHALKELKHRLMILESVGTNVSCDPQDWDLDVAF